MKKQIFKKIDHTTVTISSYQQSRCSHSSPSVGPTGRKRRQRPRVWRTGRRERDKAPPRRCPEAVGSLRKKAAAEPRSGREGGKRRRRADGGADVRPTLLRGRGRERLRKKRKRSGFLNILTFEVLQKALDHSGHFSRIPTALGSHPEGSAVPQRSSRRQKANAEVEVFQKRDEGFAGESVLSRIQNCFQRFTPKLPNTMFCPSSVVGRLEPVMLRPEDTHLCP